MKLTIHQQAGTTGQDTTVEGSVDDCLKVIDHLDNREYVCHEFDFDGKLEDIRHFSEEYLWKLKDARLIADSDHPIIYLSDASRHVVTPLSLNLNGNYSGEEMADFQRALQERVNQGLLHLL